MKVLGSILVSLFISINLFGQELETETLFLPDSVNQLWLARLKSEQLPLQWQTISKRYFQTTDSSNPVTEKQVLPVLIIDGIAIDVSGRTSAATRSKLKGIIPNDKIAEIQVIDKLPDGLYIEKAFTGIIVVRTIDKKISKALSKIKFNS
jgi:hypothetical protein